MKAAAGRPPLFTGVGMTASLERAAELKEAGADFVVETVARLLMPERSDAEFASQRERIAALPLPVLGANIFLADPRLRCTGPNADHPRVLAFAATAFQRLREIGGEYIVFGSGGARQVPPGWAKERADEQFVALLQAMGPLAARHGIRVAVEAQRTSECNYLNRLAEVVTVVRGANHPSIRVLADLFHMRWMDAPPEEIERAGPWLGLVELAEKEKRTLPGTAGDDFRPYFRALRAAGYSGRMDIEASGPATMAEYRRAVATIRQQAEES